MPDRRQHRGPHLEDRLLFCKQIQPALQTATAELSWLLTRGYASQSALKLVGYRDMASRHGNYRPVEETIRYGQRLSRV